MALKAAPIPVGVAKESEDGFGSLRTVLEDLSAVYTDYQVRVSQTSTRNSSLINPYIGNRRQQQDPRPPRTCSRTGVAFRIASG